MLVIRINIIFFPPFFFLEIRFSLTYESKQPIAFEISGQSDVIDPRMENFLSSPFEMCQLSWNRGFLSRVERFSQTNFSGGGAPLTFFPPSLSLSLEPLISIEAVQPRHLGYRFSDETWIPYLLDRNPCADRFEVHVFRVKGPDRERRETDGRERFDGRATSCPTRSILKLKFEKPS